MQILTPMQASAIPIKSVILQFVATISCTLNIITSGMQWGWPSPSLPKLQSNTSIIKITNDQGSWIAVMSLLGALLGAVIGGATVDILGRKRTIIISSVPFVASWIMIAFAPSVVLLYIARLIGGVSEGWLFCAAPMYIGEIAHPKIRGFLCSCIGTSFLFGILVINVIGVYLSIQITALICCCLPLASMVIFIFMPESPYHYLLKGNLVEAKKSLQILRCCDDVDVELQRINKAINDQMQNKANMFDLFTVKANRKALCIMMIMRGTKQVSGTAAITFYAHSIFMEASENISSEMATIIYFSVQFGMAFVSSSIVDKVGRRPLLMTSIVGSSIALAVEGTYFYLKTCTIIDISFYSMVPVLTLLVYVIIFSLGLNTIPIMILGEIFSPKVKAAALCFADIYVSVMATIVSKAFQLLKDYLGMFVPFFVYSACCLVGLVLVILFVPETTGKTLEDIQLMLGNDKSMKSRGNSEDNKNKT